MVRDKRYGSFSFVEGSMSRPGDEMMSMEEYGGGHGGSGSGSSSSSRIRSKFQEDEEEGRRPGWLQGLMSETFFGACGDHVGRRKNEKNVFCLMCCLSICPHCLPHHSSHPLLQIRRYVYQDVIRLGDLEKLVDCSYIQPYTINSAKVIFLNQRPQTRPCKGSGNLCFTCDRILQEPFHFCSLSCKVNYMEDRGEDISAILYRIESSDWPFPQFEGLRMDSSEIIDDETQIITSSSSIVTEEAVMPMQFMKGGTCSSENMGSSVISSYACSEEVLKQHQKKKKKASGFLPGIVLSLGNRRKSAPHRAPLS